MAVLVANTLLNNTWDFWRSRTNQMAEIFTAQSVTVGGYAPIGAAEIIGSLRANTLFTDVIQGGTANTPAILTISTGTRFLASVIINQNLDVAMNVTSNVVTTGLLISGQARVGNTTINSANVIATDYYGRWSGQTIAINRGGTGQNTAPTNGQLLVGNAGNFTLNTLTGSTYLTVTNAAGAITLTNAGVTRFQANAASAWRTGDITLTSTDIINSLGFIPAVANTDSWTRSGGDLNFFAGNVAIGYSDNLPRSNGKLMVRSTSASSIAWFSNDNDTTTSAVGFLDVNVANTGTQLGIRFRHANTLVGAVTYRAEHSLQFTTNGTAKVFIDSVGSLGIGTGSPLPNNGGNGIHILATNPGITLDQGNGTRWHIGSNPNSTTFNGGVRSANTFALYSDQAKAGIWFDGNANNASIDLISGGAVRMVVDPTGIVRIGTANTGGMFNVGGDILTEGSFVNYSDYRLKEDVKPLEDAIERVRAMNPVSFKWTKSGNKEEGFLAHEIQKQVPTAVKGVKDGVVFQTLDKTQVLPITIKALQDLINIVNKQQEQINELLDR